MDLSESLKDIANLIQFEKGFDVDSCCKELESMYSDILQILKKDSAFFEKERILFGENISQCASPELWDLLQKSMLASMFHGDPKEKISSLITTAKSIWSSSGQANDEIDKILNDEKTQDNFEEMIEYLTNLRTAKVFMEILEEIDIPSMGLPLDNPSELINIVRDPENPIIKKTINTIQRLLKNRLERAEFTQQQLMSDIEGVKAKIQSLFGNILNEALGMSGRRDGVTSSVLVSNSPEARRQRMLNRLQRKQREKTQR